MTIDEKEIDVIDLNGCIDNPGTINDGSK
jgi:hypothetical protein